MLDDLVDSHALRLDDILVNAVCQALEVAGVA